MQNSQANLFTRDDTFFGVCEGLGQDLGINPNLIRLAIPVPLFLNPAATLAAYAVAGMLVLLTRLIFPNPPLAVAESRTGSQLAETAAAANETAEADPEPMPLAA